MSRMAAIINVTSSDSVYTIRNLSKFNDHIPKQAWSLCLSSLNKEITKVPLTFEDIEA